MLSVGERVDRAGAADRPRRGPLAGPQVTLRPLEPDSDAPALYARYYGDARGVEVWTYIAYGPFGGPDAMLGWMRRCASSEDPLFLCVEGGAIPSAWPRS